jgi:hypothetical protein
MFFGPVVSTTDGSSGLPTGLNTYSTIAWGGARTRGSFRISRWRRPSPRFPGLGPMPTRARFRSSATAAASTWARPWC